jgi:hypothetical protein
MWSRNFSSVENCRPALEVQIDYQAAATLPPCAMTSCQSGVRGSAIVAGYAFWPALPSAQIISVDASRVAGTIRRLNDVDISIL